MKILLLEDAPLDYQRRWQMDALLTATPKAAMETLDSDRFDLLITDLLVPKMSDTDRQSCGAVPIGIATASLDLQSVEKPQVIFGEPISSFRLMVSRVRKSKGLPAHLGDSSTNLTYFLADWRIAITPKSGTSPKR